MLFRSDTQAPLYRTLASLAALRKSHRVLSRGVPTVLASNATGPGPIAWRMDHGREQALVVMNSADREVLLDDLATGCAPGASLQVLWSSDDAPDVRLEVADRLHLRLPARSAYVWKCVPSPRLTTRPTAGRASSAHAPLDAQAGSSALTLDALPPWIEQDVEVQGRAKPLQRLQLVVDRDLQGASWVQADAQGRWRAVVSTADMVDPQVEHRVVAWAEGRASQAAVFRVRRAWQLQVDHEDPAGDDTEIGRAHV